jgi:adiponectin receptor
MYHPPTPLAVPADKVEHVWHSVQDKVQHLRGSLGSSFLGPLSNNLNALGHRVSDNVHALEDKVHTLSDNLHSALSSGVHRMSDSLHHLQDNVQDLLSHRVGQPLHHLSDSVQTRAATIGSGLGHTADAVQHYLQQHAPGLSHKLEALQALLQSQLGGVVQWPVPRWPVYVYFAGAMVCLLTSCVCHLLGCCQKHISEMVWRFDYAGIAVLIMASFVPAVYYAFLCQPFWRHFYLWTTTAAGERQGRAPPRGL